jgi:hypothetical protein
MLSEMSSDGKGLGKVREVEDDDEESYHEDTQHGVQLPSTQAQTIELLARENAQLRLESQLESQRIRPRSASTNLPSAALFAASNGGGGGGGRTIQDAVPEESDYAVDELDELNELQDFNNRNITARRYSEFGINQEGRTYFALPENRKLENVKKATWQSSQGFGGLSELPQSRRHSFADIMMRNNGSITSPSETGSAYAQMAESTSTLASIGEVSVSGRYSDNSSRLVHGDNCKLPLSQKNLF